MGRIVINPGHDPAVDPGAVSPRTGRTEADLVREVAGRLTEQLVRAGHEILWLAGDDLGRVVAAANAAEADLFVSLHMNGSDNGAAAGFEVFTAPGQSAADALAERMADAWRTAFPAGRLRVDRTDGDQDKEARFFVLLATRMPAVLVELGFLTHPAEAEDLADPLWQEQAAGALARAIDRHLGGDGHG